MKKDGWGLTTIVKAKERRNQNTEGEQRVEDLYHHVSGIDNGLIRYNLSRCAVTNRWNIAASARNNVSRYKYDIATSLLSMNGSMQKRVFGILGRTEGGRRPSKCF